MYSDFFCGILINFLFFRFQDPVIRHVLSLPPSYVSSKNFSCKPKTSSALLSYIRRGIRSEVWIQWPRTLVFLDHSRSSKILKLRWDSSWLSQIFVLIFPFAKNFPHRVVNHWWLVNANLYFLNFQYQTRDIFCESYTYFAMSQIRLNEKRKIGC